MSKRFLVTLAVIILGFAGILFLTKDKADAPSGSGNGQPSNHVKGKNAKGVVLIEYGDFQCPACKAYYPVVEATVQKYSDDIQFQFRNYPLSAIHPNAFAASRAAEAAAKQDKFWEMYNALYQQQDTWSGQSGVQTIFEGYASQLGIDVDKFRTDYASEEVNDIINADIKEAKAIGADSTPTFVLDGKKIDDNPENQAAFEKLIADAIAAKDQ